jgi:hypothetical protein
MSRSWWIKDPGALRFVIVDDNPDYIRKIAAAIPPDSGIELVTQNPRGP